MTLKVLSSLALLSVGFRLAAAQAPPMDFSQYTPYLPNSGAGDYILQPPYHDAPELTPRDNVPKGKIYRFTMKSTESTIYPGIAKDRPGYVIPYQRNVTVYVPAQYVQGKKSPFLVSQDSMGNGILPTILDNRIADKRLPAMVAIMIDSGGSDSFGSQRGLEYDTVSGLYAEFIESEVLPRVTKETGVLFSKDPNARMTMGGSSGGACAFTMAWFHPEWYHRVLTYSGTYVAQQSPVSYKSVHGAWEYHEHFIPQEKRKPLRLWLQVGDRDLRANDPEGTYHNWPLANVRMAAALKAKGYPYQFVFCKDAGHVDWNVLKQTLPQALEWVWKDAKVK